MGEPETKAERRERAQEFLRELPETLEGVAEGVPVGDLLEWWPARGPVLQGLDAVLDALHAWERTGAKEDAEALHRAAQDLAHSCGIAGLLLRRRHVRGEANRHGRARWR